MESHKSVLAIGMNGVGLMPTTACKARKLLEARKAKVYRKTPFTINLLYKTGLSNVQILERNNTWITYTM